MTDYFYDLLFECGHIEIIQYLWRMSINLPTCYSQKLAKRVFVLINKSFSAFSIF